MPWNFMQLEIGTVGVEPLIGAGGLTRPEALAEVQSILDRGRQAAPAQFATAAQAWQRGVEGDTVSVGPFVYCAYEYSAAQGPQDAATAWIADFVDRMKDRLGDAAVNWAAKPGTSAPDEQAASAPGDSAVPPAAVHVLAVGKPYHPDRRSWPETAELRLWNGGVEFVLSAAQPHAAEVTAFTKGNAEFALTAADRHLMLSYQFTNAKKSGNPAAQGPGIPWSDTPWEYHRHAASHPVAVPGERGDTFALRLVLIDAATGIVKGLRIVSPPTAFADALRDAVERQAATPYDQGAAEREIQAVYDRHTSTSLLLRSDARFQVLRDGTTRTRP